MPVAAPALPLNAAGAALIPPRASERNLHDIGACVFNLLHKSTVALQLRASCKHRADYPLDPRKATRLWLTALLVCTVSIRPAHGAQLLKPSETQTTANGPFPLGLLYP